MSTQGMHISPEESIISSLEGSNEHIRRKSEEIMDDKKKKDSAEHVIGKNSKTFPSGCCKGCRCVHLGRPVIEKAEAEKLFAQKEEELKRKYNADTKKQIDVLKERAEFILQNEQIRASYMLREAHRERQEKIGALQTQLECKNLAGLMYVMCMERNRSKLEKKAIIEQYTGYILELQAILAEAQDLILNLSRGYKTAARVDQEWRQIMAKTLMEFQIFVHDFAKGSRESDQYFFDLPKLLKTKTPIDGDSAEDPCICDEEELVKKEISEFQVPKKPWFERIGGDCRPFVVFGDMAHFNPAQKRQVLSATKNIKSVPKKWKEYVFNDMYVTAGCSNADVIKDEYPARAPAAPAHWECYGQVPDLVSRQSTQASSPTGGPRRGTAFSIDVRGGMGSILKIVTTTTNAPRAPTQNKAMLLGARDSMEIASTTKVREKHKRVATQNRVVLDISKRRTSLFPGQEELEEEESENAQPDETKSKDMDTLEEDENESKSMLGSIHNDSLTVMTSHRPDLDRKIHYEKICPMEKCQRMQVDSFVRSLPAYMRASPFTHFEQDYDNYELCSPEQLAILKQRIESKKKKERVENEKLQENPLEEWKPSVDGVAVQTSELSISVPPCTCRGGPTPSPVNSEGRIFDVNDLVPMKQVLNKINRECFYDNNIEFNRFKVVGEESSDAVREQYDRGEKVKNQHQYRNRLSEVTKILKQHPSLLDIFQANAV